jgi:F-type H+-transporting ATPase subunit delta
MEEIARVYAHALFEAAKDRGKLDAIHEQLGQFADAMNENRDMQVFFFSPYFSSQEKRDGISKAVSGAEEELVNFLELLAEKHRMPAIFRIRNAFDELWAEENKRLEVEVTSAVELDPGVVKEIGDAVEKRTGRKIDLESRVDDAILGGLVLRVGNMVLDASVRSRLERLRKEVAKAT